MPQQLPRRNFRDGKVHVCARKCSTCIFRPGNLMHLQDGRVDEMVKDSVDLGGAITCHKTLDGDNAVCRGFFDVHKNKVQALQLAERLDMIAWDDPDGSSSHGSGAGELRSSGTQRSGDPE